MATNGRTLIIYATMTKNTEKIAAWFKESFEQYNFEVTMFKMAVNADWEGMQEQLYFDDYDVVCLGSPIVAGSPLMIVTRALSLGGGERLKMAAAFQSGWLSGAEIKARTGESCQRTIINLSALYLPLTAEASTALTSV